MRKYLLSLLLSSALSGTMAQVNIQPALPISGVIQKNNLWNITVVNTSTAATNDCRIELTLRDRVSGLEVLTATTGFFKVEPGVKQLNAPLLMPVQYNYISALGARNDEFIPIGSYIACYRLVTTLKTLLGEECTPFDVEPLSPPMLISPADSSAFDIQPSQFVWMPPAPMYLFNRLQYDVVITEILPGQKAEEAMQQNLPFYTEPNVPVNNLTYTGMASSFEKEKWYAWQVVAKDDNNYAGKSEVWVFKVKEIPVQENPSMAIYLLMQDDVKSTYQVAGKILHVKYYSHDKEYSREILFKDEKGNTIKKVKQQVVQGDNHFDFSLDNQFRSNSTYTMIFEDEHKKVHTLTFSITTK